MSYEIELKFRTSDHEGVAKRLVEHGAESAGSVEQEDAYFNHPARDFGTTHEAFRIRRVGQANALTYKGTKLAGPTKTREEIEIGFAEGGEAAGSMRRMLALLGFREVATIRKSRTAYHLTHQGREVEVALDLAENLGTFVEVEVIAESDAAIPEAREVVLSLARELRLEEVEPRSYLRMSLELRAAEVED